MAASPKPKPPAPKRASPPPASLAILVVAAAAALAAAGWRASSGAPAPPSPAAVAAATLAAVQEGAPVDDAVLATSSATLVGLAGACARDARPARRAAGRAAPTTPTLAYVTPWNPAGYDAALAWAAAGLVTHVSPATYQLVSAGGGAGLPALAGAPNATWLATVAALPDAVRPSVVPRVSVELTPAGNSALLAGSDAAADAVVGAIVHEVTARGYGGVVLEAPSLWLALTSNRGPGRANAAAVVERVGHALRARGCVLILVVPPATVQSVADAYHGALEAVKDGADMFSVMTYDYADATASAPLRWANATASLVASTVGGGSGRVLLGVPLYAVNHTPAGARGTASSPAALAALVEAAAPPVATPARMSWDGATAEHKVVTADGGTAFLPTPAFIRARVRAARKGGMGVALWEAGQGLPCAWRGL